MKVICISGKAQHGKDTTAGFLRDELMKDGYSVLVTHYGDLVKHVCRSFFAWDGNKDPKGRTLLQRIGTDVIRAQDENYWVRFVGDVLKFFPKEWDFVLIPDCRFPNEITYLAELGLDVTHIRVIRSNFTSPLSIEQQNHPSETALDGAIPDADINNFGTLDDLKKVVSMWITEFNGYHQISIDEILG